jgi:cytochrome c oxidase cbb3-type subunit 2
MNRASLVFLGAFLALFLSWAALPFGGARGFGALGAHVDDADGKAWPARIAGPAERGARVYADLGCASCHTQQVRQGDFGPALAKDRQWGERESYARDYLREPQVLLGTLRVGPDLRNVGARYTGPDAALRLYKLLHNPAAENKRALMPPHPFLFEQRALAGRQPSVHALSFPGITPGFELVPTERAQSLVAYLLSLKDTYDYPEEKRFNTLPVPKKPAASSHAPEGHK